MRPRPFWRGLIGMRPRPFWRGTTAVLGWAMRDWGGGAGQAPRPPGVLCGGSGGPPRPCGLSRRGPGPGAFWEDAERRVPIRQPVDRREARSGLLARRRLRSARASTPTATSCATTATARSRPIFYGLLDQLFYLWKALARPGPIGLVSGYRSPGTNAWLRATTEGVARNSLHTIGMAGGHQGARPRDRGGVASGGRSTAGRASVSTGDRTSSISTWARCEAGYFRKE